MSEKSAIDDDLREPVLSPVGRISELNFGVFMAFTDRGRMPTLLRYVRSAPDVACACQFSVRSLARRGGSRRGGDRSHLRVNHRPAFAARAAEAGT